MAPRIQCLRAVQDAASNPCRLQAAFSTTRKSMAAPPSSARSLLDLNGDGSRTRSLFDAATKEPRTYGGTVALVAEASKKRKERMKDSRVIAELNQARFSTDLTRQIRRKWQDGDVYAPHDLSPAEMKKWKTRKTPEYDVFDLLDMNPIDEYKNFSILGEFMTPMGRIKGSRETGLRPVNQRKIAKAIRRTIGLGMMPSVHRHPEELRVEQNRRRQRDEQQTATKMRGEQY